jgi:hypothetical protein
MPTAYAQITNLTIDLSGEAHCVFDIQQNRDDVSSKESLDSKFFTCMIDKKMPVYEQVYNCAKQSIFKGWEDDIIEEEQEFFEEEV